MCWIKVDDEEDEPAKPPKKRKTKALGNTDAVIADGEKKPAKTSRKRMAEELGDAIIADGEKKPAKTPRTSKPKDIVGTDGDGQTPQEVADQKTTKQQDVPTGKNATPKENVFIPKVTLQPLFMAGSNADTSPHRSNLPRRKPSIQSQPSRRHGSTRVIFLEMI
jgi:hypothetical protein